MDCLPHDRALQPQQLTVDASVGTCSARPWSPVLPSRSNPHVYLDTVILLGSLANQCGEHGRWVFGSGAAAASFIWFFALGYGARLFGPLFQTVHGGF